MVAINPYPRRDNKFGDEDMRRIFEDYKAEMERVDNRNKEWNARFNEITDRYDARRRKFKNKVFPLVGIGCLVASVSLIGSFLSSESDLKRVLDYTSTISAIFTTLISAYGSIGLTRIENDRYRELSKNCII